MTYRDSPQRLRIRSRFPIPLWNRRRKDPALIPKERLAWPPVTPRRPRHAFHADDRSDNGSGRTVGRDISIPLARAGVIVGRVLGAGSQGLAFLITYGGRQMVAKTSSCLQPMIVSMKPLSCSYFPVIGCFYLQIIVQPERTDRRLDPPEPR